MRIIFALLFVVYSCPLSAQQSSLAVQWEVTATKISDNLYNLNVTGKVADGWHVYAETDAVYGLESVKLSWENETIVRTGEATTNATNTIHDNIFDAKLPVWQGEFSLVQSIKVNGAIPPSLTVKISAYAANNNEFLPIEEKFTIELEGGSSIDTTLKIPTINLDAPAAGCGDKQSSNSNLLTIFLLGFIGGLIALLTPCVFPMIPVTVSYFTNASSDKRKSVANGTLYGIFIFIIYILASTPFHLLGSINPEIFNTISTNAWVNVFFFAVFIIFALSFFGLFEIRLPSFVANTAGAKSNLGSKVGIFFMALTLAVVSFSCTGPILGTLLVGSLTSSGGAWQLTTGMAGFGLALALPFAIFAMFPQWLKALPKSGGWMVTVKKSLAFVELALAIKFLSNADLVEHWGILKREIFIAIWLIIALLLGLYLLDVFKKKNFVHPLLQNSDPSTGSGLKKEIAWPKKIFGILTLIFAAYLIPGLTQTKFANLKLLSGFPPPLSYSIYGKDNVHGKGLEPDVINDYEAALQLAKQKNKPLLIDFTGWACVNCRKMEEHVWPEPEIIQLIKENFILVSLYVDDRKKLPSAQRFIYKDSSGKEKEIITVGDKFATFQAVNFRQVTQPLYVILSPDEKLLNHPVGYTPSVSEYKEWLECGSAAYNKREITFLTNFKKEH